MGTTPLTPLQARAHGLAFQAQQSVIGSAVQTADLIAELVGIVNDVADRLAVIEAGVGPVPDGPTIVASPQSTAPGDRP